MEKIKTSCANLINLSAFFNFLLFLSKKIPIFKTKIIIMKTVAKISLMLSFFVLFSLNSCDEAKDELFGSMTANIDGNEWASITRVSIYDEEKDRLKINATDASGEIMIIYITGTSEGSKSVGTGGDNTFIAYYKESASTNLDDSHISISGSVTISSFSKSDKKVSGSFSFDMAKGSVQDLTNPKEVKNGTFSNIAFTNANIADYWKK